MLKITGTGLLSNQWSSNIVSVILPVSYEPVLESLIIPLAFPKRCRSSKSSWVHNFISPLIQMMTLIGWQHYSMTVNCHEHSI